jgi:hypothetical protein
MKRINEMRAKIESVDQLRRESIKKLERETVIKQKEIQLI